MYGAGTQQLTTITKNLYIHGMLFSRQVDSGANNCMVVLDVRESHDTTQNLTELTQTGPYGANS